MRYFVYGSFLPLCIIQATKELVENDAKQMIKEFIMELVLLVTCK